MVMNKQFYSNTEFTELKNRINKEILRRATYRWNLPLAKPRVGIDQSSPMSVPEGVNSVPVDDKTYTINNPSEGSIVRTRNIIRPKQGENPAGQNPDRNTNVPNTSAASFDSDEARNFLIGLSRIQDINLFYGDEEVKYLAFRDPSNIEKVLVAAEHDERHRLLHESDLSPTKPDPNNGITDHKNRTSQTKQVTYPKENGIYVMPSGEYDGEELLTYDGPNEENFYDDYGAHPGDSDYHPINPFISQKVRRDHIDGGNDRNNPPKRRDEGGEASIRFGRNPRNPNPGNAYRSHPVYGGMHTSCNASCVGLCYMTCDSQCSEACTSTCWNRCGNGCSSSCGNVCTGCSTLCYSSCKTKCQNATGYSCVKAGAKSVRITTTGGHDGIPAKNEISSTTYSCTGCSYSCQFYPNKKTQCWDAACMGKCFTSCTNSCSTSCYGGCIDNASQNNGNYKSGIGRGCSSACTANCIGSCSGVCEGACTQACFSACKASCSDNCEWTCSTNCGNGCMQGCTNGCKGCTSCSGSCTGNASGKTGCTEAGCTSSCQHGCNKNCVGIACRSICGTESAGACEANCRLSCMGTSCTSKCSDACSSFCTSCSNTCGFSCGACSGMCSVGCESECNITCTDRCQNSCSTSCVTSCTERCGACSNLCYSCVGMCIGVCSVKCENGCSNCTNMCGWWCDASCNRNCMNDCSSACNTTCSSSCVSGLTSETSSRLSGPERPPTAQGYIYPNPKNRYEERESFKILRNIAPYIEPEPIDPDADKPYIIKITIDKNRKNIEVTKPDTIDVYYDFKQTTIHGGVFSMDPDTKEVVVNTDMIAGIISEKQPNLHNGPSIYIVTLYFNPACPINDDLIRTDVPIEFETLKPIRDKNDNTIVIIQRDEFLMKKYR